MPSFRCLRPLAVTVAVAAGLVLVADRPAIAAGTISIDEGTNFTESRTINVRYKGFPLYERFFVQQCWDGPSPEFDFSVSCHPDTMIFPGLLDRDEGTVAFQLFVGDDPFGAFPISCGPATSSAIKQYDTCYIRAVTYSRERNDLAVFVPITFEGARPAATTTTVPVTLAPSSASTAAPATTAPASATATTAGGPTMSAVASARDGDGPSPIRTALLAAGVAGLAAIAVRTWMSRRSARTRPGTADD